MSIRLRRSLVALAPLALAANAYANLPSPVPTPRPLPVGDGCPLYTAAQCGNDAVASSTCGQAHCGAVLSGALSSALKTTAQPWGIVIPPAGTSGAGIATWARVFPYDVASMPVTVWNADPVLGAILASSTKVATNAVLDPSPAHQALEADGIAIGSCDEYVYKSWYDYARFEDAAASCGGNADCVYAVAVRTTRPGLAHTLVDDTFTPQELHPTPSTRILSRTELAAKSATMTWDRNPFTREEMGVLLGPTPGKLGLDAATASALQALDSYVKTPPANVSWHFFDPYVVAVGDRLAWHQKMHDAQPAMTHDERRAIRERITAMASALDAVSYWDGQVQATSAQDAAEFEKVCGPYYNNQESEPDFPCAVHTPCSKDGPIPDKCKNWPHVHSSPAEKQFDVVATAASKLLAAEWNHVDPSTGQVDHGCLAWGSTKCDWWPEMVVDDYVGLVVAERQKDRAQCLTVTEGYFQDTQVPPYAKLDAHTFRSWMAGLATQIANERAALEWRGGAYSTLHYDLPGESFAIGDPSWAGASYHHGGAWELTVDRDMISHRVCRLSGSYAASVGADVSIVSDTQHLLDADLALSVGRDAAGNAMNGIVFESHFVVRDNKSIWSVGDPTANAGNAVDWNVGTMDAPAIEYEEEMPFEIVGVPIHVRIDVQGGVAASGKAHAVAPSSCAVGAASYGAIAYALDATLTPQLYASADARIAVGVPGFDVGVDGYLDLVRISLPMHAQSSFSDDANGPMIHFESDSHLHGDVLDGDVSVYAEALLYKTSKELFRFSGIGFDTPAWSVGRDYGVPLFAVFGSTSPITAGGR